MKILKPTYKTLSALLLFYALIAGLVIEVPMLPALGDAVRNLFFHVGMWFAMVVLLSISVVSGLLYLRNFRPSYDRIAVQAVNLALLFGLLGLLTGMSWAKASWGAWWINDPKLNGAAVTMLCYLAYKVLRGSVRDVQQGARIAAVYSMLAFVMMLVFMFILPRLSTGTIHPGSESTPVLNPAGLDHRLRLVFYPAIAGWILLSIWMLELSVRVARLSENRKNPHR